MKKLILVAVILQLAVVIIQIVSAHEFGDILSFQRKICGCRIYKHFAIYVDEEKMDNREAKQNIFHFSGPTREKSDCVFGTIAEAGPALAVEDNYLDGKRTKKDKDVIIAHIKEKWKTCKGKYGLLANNCEHLATYVRYGERVTMQLGQPVRPLVMIYNGISSVVSWLCPEPARPSIATKMQSTMEEDVDFLPEDIDCATFCPMKEGP